MAPSPCLHWPPFPGKPWVGNGGRNRLRQQLHTWPSGPSLKCPHKPSTQGAAAGGQLGFLQPTTACRAQTYSRGTSHPGPAPAVPTPSVFQGRMCLVWIRQCWPCNTRSGQSALRSRVTGVITTVSCGSQAGTPIPRESLGEAGRWEPHTKFPLWEKGGPGTGSFSLRETQVGVDSEGTTGLCLDFGPSPPGLAPLLGTQQPGPQPF